MRAVDASLFPCRQMTAFGKPAPESIPVADLRMVAERLFPICFVEREPRVTSRRQHASRDSRTAGCASSARPSAPIRSTPQQAACVLRMCGVNRLPLFHRREAG